MSDAPDGRAISWARGLSRLLALGGVICMLALSFATTVDVGLRAWSNSPIPGFNEFVEQLLAVAIVACFPAALVEGRHLTLDILNKSIGAPFKKWCEAFGAFALLAVLVILAWRIGLQAQTISMRGAATLVMELPRGPFLWSIAILLGICIPIQTVVLVRQVCAAMAVDRSRQGAARWRRFVLFLAIAAISVAAIAAIVVRVDGNYGGSLVILALFVCLGMWSLSLLYVPLGAAMLVAGLIGTCIVLGPLPALSAFGTEIADFLARIDLAVLPLFILMGGLAQAGGLSDDIYRFAQTLLGRRRGGLALATIGGCAGFGAVTGSSIATVATIGRAALPEMLRRGYSPELATGSIAAGGTLGILIPPSSAMILYALLTEVSIGKLFIAAIIPGAIAVVIYMATISVVVRLKPDWAPQAESSTWAEMFRALRSSVLVFLLFGVVLGGIYGGIFTATEAAAVGAGLAFLIALLRGRLRGRLIFKVLAETAATTAMLYLLILGGITFASFMAITEVPATLVGYLQSFDLPGGVVILMLIIIYVILGAVMEPYAIMLITVPITAPLVAGLGYDLVWWGIVMVVVIETGLITPPVGMNVFVVKSLDDSMPLPTIFRGVLPFITADAVLLLLLAVFPWLVLWLPSTM